MPLVRPISGPTQDTTQVVRCLTLQPCPSSQLLRTCSRVLLRERLRLPLFLTESTCQGCHEPLDPLGHHGAACLHSGHTQKRATPVERVMARICREVGGRVKFNAFLRDMNVSVPTSDLRRIRVLPQALLCFGGAQLVVDVTLWRGSAQGSGRQGNQVPRTPQRCRLVVVALGTGGRWSSEAVDFIWQVAQAKARSHPSFLTKKHWCGNAGGQGC